MILAILNRLLSEKIDLDESQLKRKHFCFANVNVTIFSNSEKLLETLTQYYSGFLCENKGVGEHHTVYALHLPEHRSDVTMRDFSRVENELKIKEEFCDIFEGRLVRKIRTRVEIFFDGKNNLIFGNLQDNIKQVVNFINLVYSRHYMIRRGFMLWNAAAVCKNGRGIALASTDEREKSSTIIRAMSQGASFVSHDRLMVKRMNGNVRALGYPKQPSTGPGCILQTPRLRHLLKEGDAERFKKMNIEDLRNLGETYRVDISRIYGHKRFELQTDLKAFYLLRWQTGSEKPLNIQEVTPEWMIQELPFYYKDLGVFDLNNTRGERFMLPDWAHLREALEGLKLFNVDGGTDYPAFFTHVERNSWG